MESDSPIEPPVVYQHPLAYLLGLEGIALLRAFAGTMTATSLWLHRWCPDATNAAYRELPIAIIWHFQLGPAANIEQARPKK